MTNILSLLILLTSLILLVLLLLLLLIVLLLLLLSLLHISIRAHACADALALAREHEVCMHTPHAWCIVLCCAR